MYPQAQITGTSPKFPLPRRFALKATTAAATLNQHEASLSQDGEWLLWGHSLNVPHPVVACPLQQSSLITVGSVSKGIELAANTIDNSHRLSCHRE